ncbi:MAG: type II toxin-antitoxin system Phd/YefM family antitoxin [Geminicoccaceae bacterium]
MKTIKASEFKARCLQLMDEVEASGEPLTITENGRPVAELAPIKRKPKSLFGSLAGQIEITGDNISPIDEPWEANS